MHAGPGPLAARVQDRDRRRRWRHRLLRRTRAVCREADRSGHVDDGEVVAEILEIVEVQLGGSPRWRLSGLESPMLEPLAVDPNRSVAPAANSIASARLVFPAPAGPTSAITRVPFADSPAMRLSFVRFTGARVALRKGARAPSGTLHRPPVCRCWQGGGRRKTAVGEREPIQLVSGG